MIQNNSLDIIQDNSVEDTLKLYYNGPSTSEPFSTGFLSEEQEEAWAAGENSTEVKRERRTEEKKRKTFSIISG